MMIGMLIVSLFFLTIVNVMAGRDSQARIGLAFVTSVFAGCFGLMVAPALLLNAALVTTAAFVCIFLKPKAWRFLKWSCAATLLAYVILTAGAIPELMEWARLRKEYPLESMADRLAYEHRGLEKTRLAQTGSTGFTDSSLTTLENELEEVCRRPSRTEFYGAQRELSLQYLHKGMVKQFIDSRGFGAMRMIRLPRPTAVRFEVNDPVPLPPPVLDYEDPSKPPEGADLGKLSATGKAPPQTTPKFDMLTEVHQAGLLDFVNPKRFGYVRDRDHVAGFIPHQFAAMPEDHSSASENNKWLIQNLELVSLLKHDEPSAYLSDHLPRMDELRNARTRRLDSWEKEALADLRQGEDLKVLYTTNRIKMLGSLRALKQCLSCHDAERGDLLGAFTYTLRREPPLP